MQMETFDGKIFDARNINTSESELAIALAQTHTQFLTLKFIKLSITTKIKNLSHLNKE